MEEREPPDRDNDNDNDNPDDGAGFPGDDDYVPEEWELEGPAVSISLGDAADLDPALLAAITGPDGLGGNALCAAYEQDQAADVLRPGPILAALTEQAARDVGRLSDDQLMGALSAARRLENRAAYLQAVTIAEFARRRAAQADAAAAARKARSGRRSADFPDVELSIELLISQPEAAARLDAATSLTARLPRALAGLAAGSIDYTRAAIIVFYTGALGDADAARADEILAAAAPGLRLDQLARKAAALEMKLDPQAAKDRKERATRDRRVEVRREASGNASLAGRELPTADAMASKSYLDAVAARLRAAGVEGTLDYLRALALTELTQGRDPLSSLALAPAGPAASAPAPNGPAPASGASGAAPAAAPRATAPFPATINLIVPAGTLLGWSATPGWAGGWGLLDPDDTRDIVRAASQHPATRWCFTFTGPGGTAIAHACAHGQHPWAPQDPPDHPNPPDHRNPPDRPDPPGHLNPPETRGDEPPDDPGPRPAGDGPDAAQAAQLIDLLRALNATPEPIARGTCDHRHAEDRYTPSRKLKHLIRARTATCSARGCGAQAIYCDLDHAVPYPDGPSCECNLHPSCRRHHRCKQAPGWRVEETEPGVMRWTTPAGRAYATTPTVYDA
jgi:hypothetical protein